MTEAVTYRSNLGGPFVAEFLASALTRFLALSVFRGRRWTKSRVAEYITESDEIPWQVSDTTIGRFVDPSSKQEPSGETLQAVAAFLIEMRAITPRQL